MSLDVHQFNMGGGSGTPDRPCLTCGLPDRHPIHSVYGKKATNADHPVSRARAFLSKAQPAATGNDPSKGTVSEDAESPNKKAEDINVELLEALEKLEWQTIKHPGWDDAFLCPVCHGDQRDGHMPGCNLARVLSKAKRTATGNDQNKGTVSEDAESPNKLIQELTEALKHADNSEYLNEDYRQFLIAKAEAATGNDPSKGTVPEDAESPK